MKRPTIWTSCIRSCASLFISLVAAMFGQITSAQNTPTAPTNLRSMAYEKSSQPPPEWLTAYRTDAGYILDLVNDLTICPKALEEEISRRYFTSNGAIQDGLRHFWVHPVSANLPLKQKAELTKFQKRPLWVIDELGARAIRFSGSLARSLENHGPCLHLSSFLVTEAQRVNIPDSSAVVVSVNPVPVGTRIVRAKHRAHNAFNQLPETASGTTPEERAIAAWTLAQPSLLKALEKDLPQPEPKENYHLCVPSFQAFNASLDGTLRSMLSLRVQWCECQQSSPAAPNAQCMKFEYPYNNKLHWLAIVERRGSAMGEVWASSLQAGDALQFILVQGVVTKPGSPDDMLWINDIHYEGHTASLMRRIPKTTKLRSTTISTYSGL